MRSHNPDCSVNRRRFLTLSAGATAVGLAGCTGDVDSSNDDSTTAATAPFSLLITDAPADIDDFESLNVTFDHARVFPADAVDDEDDGGDTVDEDGAEADSSDDSDDEATADSTGNEADEPDEDESGEDESDEGEANEETADDETNGDGRGWFILDIAGETVDLTDVVGDVAEPVFEGELEEGTYTKVELHVDSVDATLTDGESADVMVPSEKLQLTSEFEVVAEEPLEFVFDINVVQRGRGTEYNLLPVIDGSGVNGRDVDVGRRAETDSDSDAGEESGEGDDDDENDDEDDDDEPGEDEESGPPDSGEGE
ncbi:MAG: DUF4382 domain-containing protein [Natronomonas sp.]